MPPPLRPRRDPEHLRALPRPGARSSSTSSSVPAARRLCPSPPRCFARPHTRPRPCSAVDSVQRASGRLAPQTTSSPWPATTWLPCTASSSAVAERVRRPSSPTPRTRRRPPPRSHAPSATSLTSGAVQPGPCPSPFKLNADADTAKEENPNSKPTVEIEVEYVAEEPDLADGVLADFKSIFDKFTFKDTPAAAELEQRMKIAELKQICNRPNVVEVWDATASDPKLLVYLKSYRNTVLVPRHWSQKRKFLQGCYNFLGARAWCYSMSGYCSIHLRVREVSKNNLSNFLTSLLRLEWKKSPSPRKLHCCSLILLMNHIKSVVPTKSREARKVLPVEHPNQKAVEKIVHSARSIPHKQHATKGYQLLLKKVGTSWYMLEFASPRDTVCWEILISNNVVMYESMNLAVCHDVMYFNFWE